MRGGGEGRGVGGRVHHEVEAAPALVEREAEALQAAVVGEREGDERGGRAAGGLDVVGELLEAADGAGERDHLVAAGAEGAGDGIAEAAAGAGDQRHPRRSRSVTRSP